VIWKVNLVSAVLQTLLSDDFAGLLALRDRAQLAHGYSRVESC
jgi:hypothetical protein